MEESASKTFVADIAWICRGIAKKVPEKIQIEKEALKELLQGENSESSDEESLQAEEETLQKQSLRGSASDLTEGLEKYRLDDYDVDMAEGLTKGPSFKGLAYYASPLEDPNITRHADSDEEEEREDFELKDSDNLVVVAKIVKEDASLEVYIYNEENDDWYLHHDYILDAPPLCLAPFSYDPGSEDKKGNLIAVGTMDSVIHVWDLDIVNAMEPVLSLGHSSLKTSKKSKKSKSAANEESGSKKSRKKRDGSAQCHTDAVLCLDWNQLADHILASGSADQTVILWDLDEAKPATQVPDFNGMVQSLRWHPAEQSIILAGTRNGHITVTDCRSSETQSSPLCWSIWNEVEVEKVLWNHFNPFCAFACSSDGKVHYFDTRKPGQFVSQFLAHDGGANDVSQSFKVKGLLTTVGGEKSIMLAVTRRLLSKPFLSLQACQLSTDTKDRHFLELVSVKSRSGAIDFKQLKNKCLLVYFSAAWCGSCKVLEPKVKKFYEQTKDDLEVLWISKDKSEQDLLDHYENMPGWLYIDYKGIQDFFHIYGVKTIPALKLVNIDGEVIDDSARAKIEAFAKNEINSRQLVQEWKTMLKL